MWDCVLGILFTEMNKKNKKKTVHTETKGLKTTVLFTLDVR